MPPLEPIEVSPPLVPGGNLARNGGVAGLPLRLERVSARELQHRPQRFGLDTPYTATPTGWGEWIPIFPGEPCSGFIVVLAPPSALVV